MKLDTNSNNLLEVTLQDLVSLVMLVHLLASLCAHMIGLTNRQPVLASTVAFSAMAYGYMCGAGVRDVFHGHHRHHRGGGLPRGECPSPRWELAAEMFLLVAVAWAMCYCTRETPPVHRRADYCLTIALLRV